MTRCMALAQCESESNYFIYIYKQIEYKVYKTAQLHLRVLFVVSLSAEYVLLVCPA